MCIFVIVRLAGDERIDADKMRRMNHLSITEVNAHMTNPAASVLRGRSPEKEQIASFELAYSLLHFLLESILVFPCLLIPKDGICIHFYFLTSEYQLRSISWKQNPVHEI